MAACEPNRLRVMLCLDDELDADERRLVQAHLDTCTACRSAFKRERLFREGIRRRRPLHVAPDDLRATVTSFLGARRPISPAAGMRQRARFLPAGAARRLRAYSAAVLVAGLVGIIGVQNNVRPGGAQRRGGELSGHGRRCPQAPSGRTSSAGGDDGRGPGHIPMVRGQGAVRRHVA